MTADDAGDLAGAVGGDALADHLAGGRVQGYCCTALESAGDGRDPHGQQARAAAQGLGRAFVQFDRAFGRQMT